jgi:uncharacterized protein YjiS (DUF1127 family)
MIAVHRLIALRSPFAPGLLHRAALAAGWARLREIPRLWQRRRRYRAELRRLLLVGPYMIDDIGLPAKNAAEDVRKPFWQA